MNTSRVRLLCFSVVLFVLSAIPASASGVRIVRLSLAQGDVQIDRNAGDGWEQAIPNMPVIGGARIYAAEGAKAELEFEDGSSVRLAGPAQISVVELSTASNGAPVNVVQVTSGEVYVNARMHHHDDFRVLAPTGESFAITKPSHLRFNVDQQIASLAVTDGEATVQANQRHVHSGETYNYVLGQPDSAASLNSVPQQPEDSWNQQRDSYNDQYASTGAQFSGSDDPNAYGNADLGAYGSYSDLPGYGVVWQPYDVGPDWSPFDYGAWSYYPGWGWTFVSGYNWGWAPFYYGDWCYVGGRGWWWRPGPWHGHGHGFGPGSGWHPQPRFANHPAGNWSAPHPPARVAHGTVAVPGSHLSVGAIGATHAPSSSVRSAALGSPRSSLVGAPAGGPIGRVGVNSNLVRGQVVTNSAAPSIVGQKGSYKVVGPTTGRNGYEVNRAPSGNAPRLAGNVSQSPASAPRAPMYGGGSSIPRANIAPAAPRAPAYSAPHVSTAPSAPHFSGGGGGGGGFHAGGGGGGHTAGGHR